MENIDNNNYKTSALKEGKNEADLLPCRVENNEIQITPISNNKTSILSYIEYKPNTETAQAIAEAKQGVDLVVCKDTDDLLLQLSL